jgi:ribosomal protein S18 acetylase RimI-like enzyme
MIKIQQIRAANKEDLAAVNRLLPQLSADARPMRPADYRSLIRSKSNFFFAARDGGKIVGMATLVLMQTPTGWRGWIEDVVVDGEYRGRGIGWRLSKTLIAAAKKRKAMNVKLTSRPARRAANRLYRKLGFKRKITNVYKFNIRY